MSTPWMMSGFSVDASISSSNTIAGLRFAKRLSAFLIPRRALSGLTSAGSASYFQSPTAPRYTASASFAIDIVDSGSGFPQSSYAQPPISAFSYSNLEPNHVLVHTCLFRY